MYLIFDFLQNSLIEADLAIASIVHVRVGEEK